MGSLRYLCSTRPCIAHSVGVISRFMERPRTPHLLAAKRIIQYVKGTLDYGILFLDEVAGSNAELYGYTDSD